MRTPEQTQYMTDKHFCAYCHEFGHQFRQDRHVHFDCFGELEVEHIWDGGFRCDIESNWLPSCHGFNTAWKPQNRNAGRVLGTFIKMKLKEWDQKAMRKALDRDPLVWVEKWRDEGTMPEWVNVVADLVLEMS